MASVVKDRDELKQQIQQLLAADLVAVNALLSRQFRNPNMFVQDVAQHVIRFQGKQIRPILTLLRRRTVQSGHCGTRECASSRGRCGNDTYGDAGPRRCD